MDEKECVCGEGDRELLELEQIRVALRLNSRPHQNGLFAILSVHRMRLRVWYIPYTWNWDWLGLWNLWNKKIWVVLFAERGKIPTFQVVRNSKNMGSSGFQMPHFRGLLIWQECEFALLPMAILWHYGYKTPVDLEFACSCGVLCRICSNQVFHRGPFCAAQN